MARHDRSFMLILITNTDLLWCIVGAMRLGWDSMDWAALSVCLLLCENLHHFSLGYPVRSAMRRTAMGQYDLADLQTFWDEQLDTKALIGWKPGTEDAPEGTAVLAFRGTASMRNALSDLQASCSAPSLRPHAGLSSRITAASYFCS